MVKRLLAVMAALLFVSSALAELTVERKEGSLYFPDEKKWVYHFSYAYPRVAGDDYTSAHINDTYEMALDEMTQLVLPMFANAPDMRFDGKNEVNHDFTVLCNNEKLLSILQTRRQTLGEEGEMVSLEPLTFDVAGMYAGETLTLRGVMLIQAGVDAERLDEVTAREHPEIQRIIEGSSGSMSDALTAPLYELFLKADGAEGILPGVTLEKFELEFAASRDFAADGEGNLLFFFPPMLMREPGVFSLSLSIPEIEGLLESLPEISLE